MESKTDIKNELEDIQLVSDKKPVSKVTIAVAAGVIFVVLAAAVLIPVLVTQLGKSSDKDHRKDPFSVRTPLDEYVYEDDGALGVTDLHVNFTSTAAGEDYTVHLYNFTSQRWLSEAASSQPVWWHILAVIVPKHVNKSLESALLFVSGGNNPAALPDSTNRDLMIAGRIAHLSNTTAGVVFNVPNQPITLPDDPWQAGPREEDALIGLTWWRAATGSGPDSASPSMNLYLPMVKGAVRAMDVLQMVLPRYINEPDPDRAAYEEATLFTGNAHGSADKRYDLSSLASHAPYVNTIKSFTCAGISKRGWAAWLIAAVESRRSVVPDYADQRERKVGTGMATASSATLRHHPLVTTGDRINGIVPIILDIVNLETFFDRMHGSYDAWSFALWDYVMANVTVMMGTKGMRDVLAAVDPYTFLGRYAGVALRDGSTPRGAKAPTPVFLVSSGGDEFLLPDNHRIVQDYASALPSTITMAGAGTGGARITTDMRYLLLNYHHNYEPAKADPIAAFMVGLQQASGQHASAAVMPSVHASIDEEGRIDVQTSQPPSMVQVMQCDSAGDGLRDWRWGVYPGAARVLPWTTGADKAGVSFSSPTSFSATVSQPTDSKVWRAFTLLLTFPSPIDGTPYTFSAPVSVLPNTLPFETCSSKRSGGGENQCNTTMV